MNVINTKTYAIWKGGMEIDADGSPQAYGPLSHPGLDYLTNAGHYARWIDSNGRVVIDKDVLAQLNTGAISGYRYEPAEWYGVVTDNGKPDGEPVVQGPRDPCPGGYVAQTALVDHSKAVTDPTRYVDATEVPYASIPSNAIHDLSLAEGDLGFAHYSVTNLTCPLIVADSGPRNKYGEGSIALAKYLGFHNLSPKDGGAESGVTFVVFKGTSKGWPRAQSEINDAVEQLIADNGGLAAIMGSLGTQSSS